eukprot:TRINITY_DN27045_c0_g1_i1.p1 TRINITY_DN27045_c0_g1~~TRINITY_DN27045_c0_g1_i1.p1  ORF type:complete len:298 (+),score=40.49 TRINITY_DN27045_c0_g1_i1:22-915(+)
MEGFRRVSLATAPATFDELYTATKAWEDICPGRQGAILVAPLQLEDHKRLVVGISRSTTSYNRPAQIMKESHRAIADAVAAAAGLANQSFNNIMIERYNQRYRRMGYHCDQSWDLAADSCIAVYSCYEHPDQPASRMLQVRAKAEPEKVMSIVLEHNTAVVFDLDTNKHCTHKIIPTQNAPDNDWLGMTMRQSHLLIGYTNTSQEPGHIHKEYTADSESADTERSGAASDTACNVPSNPIVVSSGAPLRLADGPELRAMRQARSLENKTDGDWRHLVDLNKLAHVTSSPSDLLRPTL